MKKIYSELARIQRDLKAPKNLFNKFGNYAYRNAEGILEAVKPLLNGLALIINDEPVIIGDRFYIKARVTLTDGEESVSAEAYAREDDVKKGMDGCQITGACSSYARKYALNALLMIDDAKDSDDDSLSPKNPKNSADGPQKSQKGPECGSVTTADKLPAEAKKEQEPASKQPETAGAFIKRRVAEMSKEYEPWGFDFIGVRTALINGGVIPNVPSATMTMDQAKQLIDAVDKFYDDKRAAS